MRVYREIGDAGMVMSLQKVKVREQRKVTCNSMVLFGMYLKVSFLERK